MNKKILLIGFLVPIFLQSDTLSDAISGISHNGELRFGGIRTKDSNNHKATTLSMGGIVSLKTKPISGISLVGTFFTTNPIFGKNNESLFLSSTNSAYSILGESYLKLDTGKTVIKAGRQLIDTPFADSDDIGMIPNTFEGYSLVDKSMEGTTVVVALLDKWAGVDAPIPEKFTNIQDSSDDGVFTAGLIYEGTPNTALSFWHYELDKRDFNYLELNYEADSFNMGLQYTDQDNDNSAYGISIGGNVDGLDLVFAYNRVDGIVSNGFGGGPFFTSSEDHTIADTPDQRAKLYGMSYEKNDFNIGITHVDFDKGEDETDYVAGYEVNKEFNLDLIYSDMYDDGNMVRFFAKYKF